MTQNSTVLFIAAILALCLTSTVAFSTTTPQGYRESTTALKVLGNGYLEKKIAATVLATSYLVFAANHAVAASTPSSLEGTSQLVAPVEIVSPFGGGFGGFGFSPFGISPIGGFGKNGVICLCITITHHQSLSHVYSFVANRGRY